MVTLRRVAKKHFRRTGRYPESGLENPESVYRFPAVFSDLCNG